MRAALVRLFVVLVFWFSLFDLFMNDGAASPLRGTLILTAIWLFAEAVFAIATRFYIRFGRDLSSKE
jgi:hypothetical protein